MIHKKPVPQQDQSIVSADVSHPKLTIFAVPKRFSGHVGVIQRNAIRSWAMLQPHIEIILFGQDDPELEKIATQVNARLFPMKTNAAGTPVLSDAFAQVHRHSTSDVFCYVNSDILFGTELLDVADRLFRSEFKSFVAIGQRTNLTVSNELDRNDFQQFSDLIRHGKSNGVVDSVVCKDYFLFSTNLYHVVPDFLVGRGNWDNWMVAEAKKNGTAVIDVTSRLPAIHQNHDYSHVAGGRKNAYVSGAEARENQRLAGGRNLIRGSTPTWQLTEKGPEKRRFPAFSMVRDIPKFMTLIRKLLFLGYLLAGTAFSL